MSESATVCPNCGAANPRENRFCENCGTDLTAPSAGPGARSSGTPGSEVAIGIAPVYSGTDPLLEFNVDYPDVLSRWKIFVKWLLAIPHFVVLYILGYVISVVTIIAWFAILITGQYPRGLWDFMLKYFRYYANVTAYAFWLQRDEYPPFWEGDYSLRLSLQYPDHLSRWKIFVKWLLVIPNAFVLAFVLLAAFVAAVVAFFAILITGRMPEGIFAFITGSQRWNYRVQTYVLLMTDRYPPFSLD
jgi:Domain of unknown function (DUF4389)/zinc-ribbon domain